ncbi:MAG: DUF2892 domain-containing protein [Candidatus Latescibacterota bacterium]|jgi:hypothetical protein
MTKNMGTTDRVIRIVLALAVIILYLMGLISGTVAIILGIIAAVFLLTSLIGFCPLYKPFNISTKKKEQQ